MTDGLKATAAVFAKPGDALSLEQKEMPRLQAGEALVEIEQCTICASDLHTIRGRRPVGGPTVLGHEAIGYLRAISPELQQSQPELKTGDRVTWSIIACCGHCDRCDAGVTQKCRELKKFGHETQIKDQRPMGGFASHAIIPAGATIVPLPSELPTSVAAPANCATATVVAAFRTGQSCHGQTVLIVGAGMLGITATAYARHHGAKEVIVVDPQEERRRWAKEFGATQTASELSAVDQDVADLIVDMSGIPDAIEASVSRLNVGGILILVGSVFPARPVQISAEQLVRKLNRIEGVHNYRADDLREAVDFLATASIIFPFESLVEQKFSLDRVNDAIDAAESAVRVAVCPGLDREK